MGKAQLLLSWAFVPEFNSGETAEVRAAGVTAKVRAAGVTAKVLAAGETAEVRAAGETSKVLAAGETANGLDSGECAKVYARPSFFTPCQYPRITLRMLVSITLVT